MFDSDEMPIKVEKRYKIIVSGHPYYIESIDDIFSNELLINHLTNNSSLKFQDLAVNHMMKDDLLRELLPFCIYWIIDFSSGAFWKLSNQVQDNILQKAIEFETTQPFMFLLLIVKRNELLSTGSYQRILKHLMSVQIECYNDQFEQYNASIMDLPERVKKDLANLKIKHERCPFIGKFALAPQSTIPWNKYNQINNSEMLKHHFSNIKLLNFNDTSEFHLLGLLFARPNSPFTKSFILPHIDYWHERSERNIDFYFAGYTAFADTSNVKEEIVTYGQQKWFFDIKVFNDIRKEFESETRWKYSGAVDLILVNIIKKPNESDPFLDFENAMCFQIDQLIHQKAIFSPETFFEQIIRFADESGSSKGTIEFSNQQGLRIGMNAAKKAAVSLFPNKLGDDILNSVTFAVKNIGKK